MLQTSDFYVHIYRIDWNKYPLKILGKVGMAILRDCRKFSGHPYIRRIAQSSLRKLILFLVVKVTT